MQRNKREAPAGKVAERLKAHRVDETLSYPDETNQSRWLCEAKRAAIKGLMSANLSMTAYVIGIRPLAPTTPLPIMRITKNTAPVATNPVATTNLFADGSVITGGGARAVPVQQVTGGAIRDVGQIYLTGMLPLTSTGPGNQPATQWQARGIAGSSTGTVTAYAINVLFKPPELTSINPAQAAPGTTVTISGENFVRNKEPVRNPG